MNPSSPEDDKELQAWLRAKREREKSAEFIRTACLLLGIVAGIWALGSKMAAEDGAAIGWTFGVLGGLVGGAIVGGLTGRLITDLLFRAE